MREVAEHSGGGEPAPEGFCWLRLLHDLEVLLVLKSTVHVALVDPLEQTQVQAVKGVPYLNQVLEGDTSFRSLGMHVLLQSLAQSFVQIVGERGNVQHVLDELGF